MPAKMGQTCGEPSATECLARYAGTVCGGGCGSFLGFPLLNTLTGSNSSLDLQLTEPSMKTFNTNLPAMIYESEKVKPFLRLKNKHTAPNVSLADGNK